MTQYTLNELTSLYEQVYVTIVYTWRAYGNGHSSDIF